MTFASSDLPPKNPGKSNQTKVLKSVYRDEHVEIKGTDILLACVAGGIVIFSTKHWVTNKRRVFYVVL